MPRGRALALLLVAFLVIAAEPANASGDGGAPTERFARMDAPAVEPPIELTEVLYAVPPDYDTFVQWWQQLEAQYPDFLRVWSPNQAYGLGQVPSSTAHPPYDLYYVRLTNESLGFLKPEVFFMGNPHGDERTGPIGAYWFVHWLLRNAFNETSAYGDWLRWVLDNREVYFAVSHNPDGFDRPRRGDYLGRDLNREADHDGPEAGSGWTSVFQSVQGRTVVRFMNEHQVRAGMDFHGGIRGLLYPWGSTRGTIGGVSPVTGRTWYYAPPDFEFFDVFGHRMGDFIGDFGGNYGAGNVGTPQGIVMYEAAGTYLAWAYGADTAANPAEAPYVDFDGAYPGAGALWFTPEVSFAKNPAAGTYGGDDTLGWGIDVRRMLLAMIDVAQPYVRWHPSGIRDGGTVQVGHTFEVAWQVNGSLVADSTYVQYGADPDPLNNPDTVLLEHQDYAGQRWGGTGWEGAMNGATSGTVWRETIRAPSTPGTYYFVARAKVDQRYSQVLRPDVYGSESYLRVVKERTWTGWSEDIAGADGIEHMESREWWDSPVLRVEVVPDTTPPVVTLRSPPNGSVVKAGDVLDFRVVDGNLNWTTIAWDTEIARPFPPPWDFPISAGFFDGAHRFYVTAADKGGLTTWAQFDFTVDNTPPSIALVSPAAGSVIPDGAVIDLDVADVHLALVAWSVGGPDTPLAAPFDVDTTGWPDGPVGLEVSAFDAPGNYNRTTFAFTIDAAPPVVTLLSPPNGSVIPAGTVLDFSVWDASGATATWDAGGGSQALVAPYDVDTTGWTDGPVTVVVAASDPFGRTTIRGYGFTIDGRIPLVSLVSPTDGAVVKPGTTLDVEVSDDNLVSAVFDVGFGPIPFGAPYDLATGGWADGTYAVTVRATDAAGNVGTITFSVTVDGTPPSVSRQDTRTIVAPGRVLDFDVTDSHLSDATWTTGGPEADLPSPYDLDTSGWADGEYELTIRATDLAGNEVVLAVNVTIDGTPPVMAVVDPVNLVRPGTVVRFSVSDLHLVNVALNIGNLVRILPEPYEVDTTGWADGAHEFVVVAGDEAGNMEYIAYIVWVDGTPPAIGPIQFVRAQESIGVETTVTVTENNGPAVVTLHWRFEGGAWSSVPMENLGGSTFRALVAVGRTGTFEAYVAAEDVLGNAAESQPASVEVTPQPRPSGIDISLVALAAMGALLAVVAAVLLLLLRRRRRSAPEDAASERRDVGQQREEQNEK